jgi:hypothetical protein
MDTLTGIVTTISEFATSNPTLVGALVALLTGSVAVGLYVKYWTRPIVSVRLQPKRGCYDAVDIRFTDDKGNKGTQPAKYLRLHVENTGRSTIKDCSGDAIRFCKRVDGREKTGPRDVLSLGWAHYPESKKRDIPRGADYYMDVATLLLHPDGSSALWWERMPTNLQSFIFAESDRGKKVTHMWEARIIADNARPLTIPVEFTFDPRSHDLDVKWCNRSRYPLWSFWRRWRSTR